MKSVFTVFITVIFVVIAMLSVFAMNHGNEHAHDGCFASTMQGFMDCPNATNSPFAFLSFHLNAFKFFSTAIFASQSGSFSLVVLAVLLILVFALRDGFRADSLLHEFAYHKKRPGTADFPFAQRTLSWIALHEKRDPARFV